MDGHQDDEPRRLEEYATLVRRGRDPSWPLDDEDPDTSSLHDVAAWIQVYRDLWDVETAAIEVLERLAAGSSTAVRREIEGTNIPLLVGNRERYEARLGYWSRRERELRDGEE